MLILKKIVIKAFWFLINIFLVPTGYFYLLTITKPLKLKKLRVFNFLQLDDGNLNFIAIHDGNHVFVKIDFFGRNLENELKAYKYLENHELNFSLTIIVYFEMVCCVNCNKTITNRSDLVTNYFYSTAQTIFKRCI